jgi:hypothetical protein
MVLAGRFSRFFGHRRYSHVFHQVFFNNHDQPPGRVIPALAQMAGFDLDIASGTVFKAQQAETFFHHFTSSEGTYWQAFMSTEFKTNLNHF